MRKYFYFLTDVNPLTKLYFSGPIFLRVLNVQFNSIWSKTGLVMVMCLLGSNPIPLIWPKLYHFLRWYDSHIMLYHLPYTIRCNSRKCSYQQPDFYIIYVPDLSLAGALNPRTCKAVLPSTQPLFSVGVGQTPHPFSLYAFSVLICSHTTCWDISVPWIYVYVDFCRRRFFWCWKMNHIVSTEWVDEDVCSTHSQFTTHTQTRRYYEPFSKNCCQKCILCRGSVYLDLCFSTCLAFNLGFSP